MSVLSVAQLFAGIDHQVTGECDALTITAITADSRQVQPGCLFVAVQGVSVDGHDFVEQAVGQGACVIVVNRGRARADLAVPVVEVADTVAVLGPLAANFFGRPAEKMTMVALTGTNGKTTCSYLLEEVVNQAGGSAGVIGTVNFRFAGICREASHTTPDPVQLQALLADMAGAGVSHVIMEVSSHALEQGRVNGIAFDVALFTNLSRDHLDYHGDMERYYAAKKILFSRLLKKHGRAVIVCDGDEGWGRRLATEVGNIDGVQVTTCGPGEMIAAEECQLSLAGVTMQVRMGAGRTQITSPLIGEFNVRNILAVMGAAQALAMPQDILARALAHCQGAPGRMETVTLPGSRQPKVIVDYAHTPDALSNVLQTIKPLTTGRLVVVFGCGGDRDRGKRPIMGSIAVQFADVAIATSDNPRSEEPLQILKEIEAGMQESGGVKVKVDFLKGQGKEYLVIESRQEAIACAISLAQLDDVVLISGKGHEDYQLTSRGKIYFDDRLHAKEELEKVWGKAAGAA